MTTADMKLKALPAGMRRTIEGAFYSQILLTLLAILNHYGWFKAFSILELCMISSAIISLSICKLGLDSDGNPLHDRWRIKLYSSSLIFHCFHVAFIMHEELRKLVG